MRRLLTGLAAVALSGLGDAVGERHAPRDELASLRDGNFEIDSMPSDDGKPETNRVWEHGAAP
jgi:hypothetical protein